MELFAKRDQINIALTHLHRLRRWLTLSTIHMFMFFIRCIVGIDLKSTLGCNGFSLRVKGALILLLVLFRRATIAYCDSSQLSLYE